MVLKLKITIQYINDIASPDIRILPSRFSSPKIRSRSASLIPAHLLNLLLSIWPPLLVMIQRIRSRGDCDGPFFSSFPEFPWFLYWFFAVLSGRGGKLNNIISWIIRHDDSISRRPTKTSIESSRSLVYQNYRFQQCRKANRHTYWFYCRQSIWMHNMQNAEQLHSWHKGKSVASPEFFPI